MNSRDLKEHLEALYKASIGTILDRFGRGKEEKKKVDKKLYEEIAGIISPEFMRDFFYELRIEQYWIQHRRRITEYIHYTSTAGKKFFDKKIQKKYEAFNNSIKEFEEFLLSNFFISNHNEHLAVFHPYLRKRKWDDKSVKGFDELLRQLSAVQKDAEKSYESFIMTLKKRLQM